ncbi:MAG: glycosyltransferase family 39 protein [Candidatus Promineifilaceae bacterium]|nr:glycosyltransferase family 39 protein [Candidatus Promineifilaceae bacterium]
MYHLDHFSFWQDESLTPLRAGYAIPEILSNRIVIQEGVTQDTHPPLYFLLIHFTRLLLGESDFAYRFPSVLASVLTIPLLFQFGRRLLSVRAGLLAAFLATINPLQVWYAQEARMYTFLLLLTTAASYALWRALDGGSLRRWFLIYLLFAGLSFLTHYTALFLIAGHFLLWAWLLLGRRQRRLLLIGGGVVLLMILPFLPFFIPRLLSGPETNYTYVSPLIMLQDIVHGFGMGSSVEFRRPVIRGLDVAVAVLLAAGALAPRTGESGWKVRSFLIVYLFAVVTGLALGSLVKPMYQGIRHIFISATPFFLLLARGVSLLPRRWLIVPAMAVLVAGPFISLNNLYTSPRFAKDDLRSLIYHIEERAGEDDAVVYNNAILMTFHWHYQRRSDLAVTALPIYPYEASEQTEGRLVQLAEEYERLWFVIDPPADRRDEGDLVERWLERNLAPIEQFGTRSRTAQATVKAYATEPRHLTSLPAGAHPADLTWPGAPALRGWEADFKEPATAPTLWFDLFWENQEDAPRATHLQLALRDERGNVWADLRRPLVLSGTEREDSALVRLPYGLTLPVGTPPGVYELMLLPWDDAAGEDLGAWQTVGDVTVAGSGEWPMTPLAPIDALFSLQFRNGLQLLGIEKVATHVRPGNALPLFLYWQAEGALSDPALAYDLQVVGPSGETWITQEAPPGPAWLAPEAWPVGTPVRELLGLLVPADAPPGQYELRWRLRAGEEVIPGRPGWRPWRSKRVTFGEIRVVPWPLETALPEGVSVVEASFGDAIQLYGFDLVAEELQPGDTMALMLYWLAEDVPQGNYHVFVHVVGEEEAIVTQADRIPVESRRPTQGWRAGEVLSDPYALHLPSDLSPGVYRVYVGLYEPDRRDRLPVVIDEQPQADNRLLLATITVR